MNSEGQAKTPHATKSHRDPRAATYARPKLVKLGTIYTMTRGSLAGFQDILMGGVGGTQGTVI